MNKSELMDIAYAFAQQRKERWIQKLKKGALHRQLGIPEDVKIPQALLDAIMRAEIGETITNPTDVGKKKIKVTRLLKRRVQTAMTLKKLRKRKK